MTPLNSRQAPGLTAHSPRTNDPKAPHAEPLSRLGPMRSLAGHSAIAVKDIDRSITFYADLGFELLWRDPDWAFLRSPVGWGLALLGPSYRGAGPHIGFHLEAGEAPEGLKVWHERCQAAGARGLGHIHSHRDGSRSFYASDPDGNTLEWVQEPAGGLLAAIAASADVAGWCA